MKTYKNLRTMKLLGEELYALKEAKREDINRTFILKSM